MVFEFGVFSEDGNDFIGSAGLNLIVRRRLLQLRRYWVRQSQQRKGVASACVAALSEFGFRELGLHRIEIVVAVGERCGRPKSRRRAGVCCEEQVANPRPARCGKRLLAGAGEEPG